MPELSEIAEAVKKFGGVSENMRLFERISRIKDKIRLRSGLGRIRTYDQSVMSVGVLHNMLLL